MIVPIIQLIVLLVVIGLLLWAVEAIVPMDDWIKKVIRVLVIVVVCLWLLSLFGLIPGNSLKIGSG